MTRPATDLSSLMTVIGNRYKFTSKDYPGFDVLSLQQQIEFIVRHSALHITKSAGKISAEAEAADHGLPMNRAELFTATTKMLVNVLKLAQELGYNADDLAANVPNVMASAPPPSNRSHIENFADDHAG